MKIPLSFLLTLALIIASCQSITTGKQDQPQAPTAKDTIAVAQPPPGIILPRNIAIKKELAYDKYTLDDVYAYKDTTRQFKYGEMKKIIAKIENIQKEPQPWGILQNRNNSKGEAPLVPNWSRNEYDNIADTLGVERFQGIPLYLPEDSVVPVRYGRDGELVHLIRNDSTSNFIGAQTVDVPGHFLIPRKYVQPTDTIRFERIVFVGRTDQNIATMERTDSAWVVRSKNPATTGKHNPPYAHDTPLGIFVVQDKKVKMYYLVDGTSTIAGYAPWASRFCNGGYIHGIPTNHPKAGIIEYSSTLGTIPRSHMCVRNASSHSEFVFNWVEIGKALVVVMR